jgi:cytochrome b
MRDAATGEVRVWDLTVRLFHWSLVAAVTLAWLTDHGPAVLHDNAGYVALGLVAFRIVWGFVGTRHARFEQFLQGPGRTLRYAVILSSGHEERHLGHNPLGGWMIAALLACVAATGLTGWLYTTDEFWGVGWMEELHEGLAVTLLWLIALHVGGVIFTSLRQRENLVAAMWDGRKRLED